MKRAATAFETTVRAFRDLTAEPADGDATRARVLTRAGRDARGRASGRRISLAVAAALVALCSAAAAWTTGVRGWRTPAAMVLGVNSMPERLAAIEDRPRRVIPLEGDVADAPESAVERPEGSAASEARAYGRAHRAHFVEDAPARALAAWDDYLAAFPRGVFAPEARYNRAVCLVRLGRLGEATRALRAFAVDGPAGYRATEARLLLDWVHDRMQARPGGRGATEADRVPDAHRDH